MFLFLPDRKRIHQPRDSAGNFGFLFLLLKPAESLSLVEGEFPVRSLLISLHSDAFLSDFLRDRAGLQDELEVPRKGNHSLRNAPAGTGSIVSVKILYLPAGWNVLLCRLSFLFV